MNMKIIKKNQIVIFVIALMLVSAGYLNYTANNKNTNTITTAGGVEKLDVAGIGDAKLVSSNSIEETNEIQSNSNENNINTELSTETSNNTNEIEENKTNTEENENTTLTTSSNTKEDENNIQYFKESKLTRDTMYSQMLDTYQKILENDNIASDQKTIAQTEIKNINDLKNKIMICENLIKTKGITELVIFVNDKSINVITQNKEISQEQIAQIQNVIEREMQVDINNIHISSK